MLRIALGAACLLLVIGRASAAETQSRISLHAPTTLDSSVGGRTVVFTGTVGGAPAGASVAFERHSFSLVGPGKWETLLASPIRRGRFRIIYRGAILQGSKLRFAVTLGGRLLFAGRPEKVVPGEPARSCEGPSRLPPPVMVSRGTIVGAIIRQDGTPFDTAPCGTGTPLTVSVQDATGKTIAEESIAGLQSFVFFLQPGTYSIHAGPDGECTGSGTVGESGIVHVDAVCPAALTAG